jgi:hypothetical protein
MFCPGGDANWTVHHPPSNGQTVAAIIEPSELVLKLAAVWSYCQSGPPPMESPGWLLRVRDPVVCAWAAVANRASAAAVTVPRVLTPFSFWNGSPEGEANLNRCARYRETLFILDPR